MLTSPKDVEAYLYKKSWVPAHVPLRVEALSGGVSNQVWKITGSDFRWVMKQALAKLKVKEDWFSDVRRIEREKSVMEELEPFMPKDCVPEVLFSDDQAHIYVMTCAPEEGVPWKQQLLQGVFVPAVAENAGKLLASMHRISSEHAERMRGKFGDIRFFEELRIQPFYEHVKKSHPNLEMQINILIRSLRENGVTLVHGDYSPKNMLVTPDHQIILLDYEVSHWGNPLFDWAFCTAHLLLKGLAFNRSEEAMQLIEAFLGQCSQQLRDFLPHLGLLLIARIDGKSPVEYISESELKDRVRQVGIRWVRMVSHKEQKTLRDVIGDIRYVMKNGAINDEAN